MADRIGLTWFDASLITLLDRLLLIFIALEVLQNVTAYVRCVTRLYRLNWCCSRP